MKTKRFDWVKRGKVKNSYFCNSKFYCSCEWVKRSKTVILKIVKLNQEWKLLCHNVVLLIISYLLAEPTTHNSRIYLTKILLGSFSKLSCWSIDRFLCWSENCKTWWQKDVQKWKIKHKTRFVSWLTTICFASFDLSLTCSFLIFNSFSQSYFTIPCTYQYNKNTQYFLFSFIFSSE